MSDCVFELKLLLGKFLGLLVQLTWIMGWDVWYFLMMKILWERFLIEGLHVRAGAALWRGFWVR